MTHQIILDQKLLEKFIDWLPELQPNEKFFFCLQARKKYCPLVASSDKTQLKRFTASKKDILRKIQQLECKIGAYTNANREPFPDEALVLYVTPNPRNTKKAAYITIKDILDSLSNDVQDINPYQLALSAIHRSKGRSCFVHFDIDRPSDQDVGNTPKNNITHQEIKQSLENILYPGTYQIVLTRGGYHVLVYTGVEQKQKNWYPLVSKVLNPDQSGDIMMPVPGCRQGDFMPRFI